MARAILAGCLLLFCFGVQQINQVSANPLLLPFEAVDFIFTAKENLDKIKELFAPGKNDLDKINPADAKMLNKLNGLATDISKLKKELSSQISHLSTDLMQDYTRQLFEKINKVHAQYNYFMHILLNANKYNPKTFEEFAMKATSYSKQGIQAITNEMHNALSSPADISGKNILSILSKGKHANIMCVKSQSPYQIISELYNTIVYTDMKSVTMVLFAYDYIEAKENTSYKIEKSQVIEAYKNRTNNSYENVKNAMATASRDIWRCDPETYEEDRSYSKLQEVFQKVLIFERDISPYTCIPECDNYKEKVNSCDSPYCDKEQKKKCTNGKIRDCQSMSNNMTFCISPPYSTRQYDWLMTETGVEYGRDSSFCEYKIDSKDYEHSSEVGGLFITCSWCLCTCDDNDQFLDRYFSLREVVSDKKQNKVVTGVRLRKENHIYYIQIQQGKLSSNGTIDSTEWKNVEKIQNRKYDMFRHPFLYAVTWDSKTVYLDDIEDTTNNNNVLTGLSFREIRGHLRLDVELTEFDYETGQLGFSSWLFNPDLKEHRSPVILKTADDPILYNENKINSRSGQYIEFQTTSVEKDLGQLTVPFLDMQEVESNPPVPLSGAGIFHKATDQSGGFLAFKLKQLDVSSRLQKEHNKIE